MLAPTTGETTITLQDKTKSNTTKTSMHPELKKNKTQNQHTQKTTATARFSRLL